MGFLRGLGVGVLRGVRLRRLLRGCVLRVFVRFLFLFYLVISGAEVCDGIGPTHEHLFLTAFLSAYPTFSTGDEIFYLLAERYQMEQPSLLTEEEIEIWKERKLKVTQLRYKVFLWFYWETLKDYAHRVLNVIKAWIEQHYLMLEEPLIANKLTEFLRVIKSPPINAELAGKLLQTLQQQVRYPFHQSPQSFGLTTRLHYS
jgi:hypothetical protein